MRLVRTVSAALMVSASASIAYAGGLERGGYNVDLLFDPAPFAFEATGTYVMPQRKLDNVVDTNPLDGTPAGPSQGVKDTESYFSPRLGVKVGIGEQIDCMVDYSQPWGVHTNPGANWAGANHNIETKVDSHNFGGTCSYKMQAGKGQFRVLGGVFYQKLEGFKERQVFFPTLAGNGIGRLDLEGSGVGWRVGAAYEIPEIAFRASLVYNSRVKLDDITGTLDLSRIPGAVSPPVTGRITPVFGATEMPETVELKVQSGIAPGWLAFGSVKWVNWSILQSIPFCPEATRGIACTTTGPTRATSLDLLYRDGWTVSGGIGHKINEQWSAAASLTWDRGTSQGFGHQADSWTLGGGVAYTPNENVEMRLSGALGILTSGESGAIVGDDGRVYGNDISYTFDNDLVGALSASMKVKW
ncbi:OmpP1/FadL family transporter [Nitratireductor rhodophyticola]|uniref:OmpP1/FadL family transporter n=1 Tax=Nitratireductor rhodophyticola TaxID=2854036 RepID=A0ABS7R3T9_9HYPH|nr:OmpP1/FadL family transporter [Nitratireductor rhodophyticola]MBY8915596.1 OmpP1/FadL family transporter [Nitratireductor rhodophyticola]MBY8919335.1 OmpP1/FadL family transporter [Nitratireductor rhodophyticola]MEC9244261.1 OmpP1/FadL family transporter [Pseudomonadota bacterium]WPZ13292.1 OmpP1/FadL family transporter [Nitratireductor rhodophyticola]